MVKVVSSMGRSKTPMVNITLLGVHDVAQMLFKVTNDINTLSEETLIRAGAYVSYEVQQSIMGNRGETKSVDTGNFANSIEVNPMPGFSLTKEISVSSDIEYAQFLEFGTSKLPARSHFQNTAFRVEPALKEQFDSMIKSVCGKNK